MFGLFVYLGSERGRRLGVWEWGRRRCDVTIGYGIAVMVMDFEVWVMYVRTMGE